MKTVIGLSLTLVIGLIVLLNTIWVTLGHFLARMFVAAPILGIGLLVIVIAFIVGYLMESRGSRDTAALAAPIGVTFGVIGLVIILFGSFSTSFFNASATYNASTVKIEKSADTLSYDERVPFEVATAVSSRSLGDTTGEANGSIRAIPGTGEFSTMVVRRGFVQGYESVQVMGLPLYGSFDMKEDVSFCKFDADKAGQRFGGGWFTNSLSMRAYNAVGMNPLTFIHANDSFSVCDGDTPVMYIPVVKMKTNGFTSYDVPAGVVIYNGKTGAITYEADFKLDGKPVYPQSIAEAQLNSVRASQGYNDYFFGRAGFETTSQSDEDDVNGSNNGNFALSPADSGKAEYVTPLTPRGASSSVVGIAQSKADTVENGKLNTLIINKYSTSRQAPSTVASNIVSGVLSGYKSSGLTVFEVIPSIDGGWTASIGKNQNILYRAVISADGDTELFSDPNAGKTDSNDNENTVVENTTGKNVSEMTNDELRTLANSILDELATRAEMPVE